MRFYFAVPIVAAVHLAGCAELAPNILNPKALENLTASLQASSFQKHELSGVKLEDVKLWIIGSDGSSLPVRREAIDAMKEEIQPDEYFQGDYFNKTCRLPSPGPQAVAASAIATKLLAAWGSWLFEQFSKAVQSRLDDLKAKSAPREYGAREAVRSANLRLQGVRCIVIKRAPIKTANGNYTKGFIAVVVRENSEADRSGSFSDFRVSYARLDNSVAWTDTNPDGSSKPVDVTIRLDIKAARSSRDNHPAAIDTLASLRFDPLPLRLPAVDLEKPTRKTKEWVDGISGCDTKNGRKSFKDGEKCPWRKDHIAHPSRSSPFFTIEVSVQETGSHASAFDKASAGYKKLSDESLKVSYEAWLKERIARLAD